MKVVFKDRKDFYLNITCDDLNDFYTVKALSFAEVLLGAMTFKTKQENYCKKIWLYKIETFGEHQQKGVGTKLINFLEFFAQQNGVRFIEGKYYPENDRTKSFYEHRGYSIEKDGYDWFVYKNLNFSDEKNIDILFSQNAENISL